MQEKKSRLLKKREKLLGKIIEQCDFIKGSISTIKRNNKKSFHLTYKDEKQKTHTKYISAFDRSKAMKAIKKYEHVKKMFDKISEINIKLLKNNEDDKKTISSEKAQNRLVE